MKWLRRILPLVALLCLPATLRANARYNGYCMKGGQSVLVSNLPGTPQVMASYPQCTVTVFLKGTVTLAPIFDQLGNILPNPTQADQFGFFFFYTTGGLRVDIQLSGAGISTYTIGDVLMVDLTGSPAFLNVTQTFTAPQTFSSTMNAIGGGNFSGVFTGNPAFTGTPTIANLNNLIMVEGQKYPRTDTGIQQAINDSIAATGGGGGTVFLTPGHYILTTGNMLVPGPVVIFGGGRSTWLDNASLPSTQDVFIVNPTTDGNMIRFADFMICCTATAGQYPFHLIGGSANITNFSMERVIVNQMGNLAAIPNTVVFGEGSGLAQGTPNVSNFNHNTFIGGIVLTTAGDTVRITDNQISFVGKMDIQFQPGGVSTFILSRNNFTLPGGVRIGGTGTGAIGCLISENEFETETASTEPNNSLVDLDGTAASNDVNCVISNNSFQVLAGLGINANGLRVNWGVNTQVFGNRFERGVSPAKDIFLTANSVNTLIGTNVWFPSTPFMSTNLADNVAIYTPNRSNMSLAAQISQSGTSGPFTVSGGTQGVALSGGIATLDETGTIRPLLSSENTFGTINLYGYHGTCLVQGVIGASYMCDGNGVSGDIGFGVSTGFLPVIVPSTAVTFAGFYFKEVSAASVSGLPIVNSEFCYGDSTAHLPRCSYNNANFHGLRTTELGTCTMVAGTCTVTWSAGFSSTPLCNATWNGTGALTGIVKAVPSVSNCVITSSVGGDTAVMQVLGTANPN